MIYSCLKIAMSPSFHLLSVFVFPGPFEEDEEDTTPHNTAEGMRGISITCLKFRRLAVEGEGRDGHRDQIVTGDVGVSLCFKTHALFMCYSGGTSTQCYACQ